jgi:hypothetical protein
VESHRIKLENDGFISYQVASRSRPGHWHPESPTQEDFQQTMTNFRYLPESMDHELSGLARKMHEKICLFDNASDGQYGDEPLIVGGYYPQLSWMALDQIGVLDRMHDFGVSVTEIELDGIDGCAGLVVPSDEFKMAVEMSIVNGGQIDWGSRTYPYGRNLLFLYAGNVVNKVYPDSDTVYGSAVRIESFMFDEGIGI